MLNVKKEKLMELSDLLHNSMMRKKRQAGTTKDDILIENRIFGILCDDSGVPPTKCAIRLNDKFGYDLTGEDIINIFRRRRMAVPKDRFELFKWCSDVADLFEKSITGDKDAFAEYEKLRKESAVKSIKHHDSQDRIAAIMIYRRFPEIVTEGDSEILDSLGNTLARYLFYDISDAICEVYEFPTYRERKSSNNTFVKTKSTMTLEQALKRIDSLESELERTSSMLSDLQNEFEEQLNESKVKELTDFFAKLNSEKYGSILDQLLELQKGLNTLRKNGYEVPIEINGLLIVIKKLTQFVQDSHINPILKPNSIRTVRAADVEFSDYIGTPFTSETEEKRVKALSPGWIFKDKEIQISRPRVEEVNE